MKPRCNRKRYEQELSIDHSEIARLAKESQAIRDRLLSDAEPVSEEAEPVEASVDEQLMAAASWVPEVPKETPTPIEVPAKPPVKTVAIDWSRVGGRRQARAMLRLTRFAAIASAAADHVGQAERQGSPMDKPVQIAASGMDAGSDNGDEPAASGFLHRPEDTPADLLTDLTEVAHIMGASDDNRAKLIAAMMANGWEVPGRCN